jgi:hypothetical protein
MQEGTSVTAAAAAVVVVVRVVTMMKAVKLAAEVRKVMQSRESSR